MFSKFVVAACLLACAIAEKSDWDIAQESNGSISAAKSSEINANTMANAADYLGKGLESAQGSMARFDGVPAMVKKITGDADGTKLTVEKLLKDTVANINKKLGTKRTDLLNSLKTRLAKLNVPATMKTANTGIANDVAAVNKALSGIETSQKASAAAEKAMRDCQAKKQVYDSKNNKCDIPTLSATAHMQKVHHHGFEGDDGRDAGYLDHRTLEYEKFEEDTYVRVFYYDNLRVHGHTAHGRWNVMFCGPGGSNCAKCKDPGQIMNWRYSSHQHNWWMNDHTPGTAFGLCRASESGKIGKGKHSIRIMIDDNRYDMYTGSGDYGSIMVDEVLRY